ncbi:MAG: glycoside hydrolase family 9 protein [Flavihumibacter sp.]
MAQTGTPSQWIRINQLGYLPGSVKTAVWCSRDSKAINRFEVIDDRGQVVYRARAAKASGAYGPFQQTVRLDFSGFRQRGRYRIKAGEALSPLFPINEFVYQGSADFCLRYMRQQRSGFNPTMNDSCHNRDGYTLYGPMPDSTHIDVAGGWHDASDYLQYASTSANATCHLLMALEEFPGVFGDQYAANGLPGKNGLPDIYDEAKWGLDWLLKMHPQADWMFAQIADDRDHAGMRLPKLDSQYNRGAERPVYFLTGYPQQQGKGMNKTSGTSSLAARFSSAFALGSRVMQNSAYTSLLAEKAKTSLAYAFKREGFTQTASVRSPYVYAEENWVDDMELALAAADSMKRAMAYAAREPQTPWLGKDTASHYQWYPFINLGHRTLVQKLMGAERDSVLGYYKKGIDLVWQKAKQNGFYRGIPFIWCSNNLTVAFAMQCRWYRELSGDKQYEALEQACIDWLFGCNPWGTSMVYGLPASGDTPVDPHAAFSLLKKAPVDGGLVDGPVYSSIFKSLIGLTLLQPDEYAAFQSDLVVYHDDAGDYSTNEPTMDGTASLIYLLASLENEGARNYAVTRMDSTRKTIYLVFTGHEFAEGGSAIRQTLRQAGAKASFFLTGDFYRNKAFSKLIHGLQADGHFLGPHSDQHLLYCDWSRRDSTLVTRTAFEKDLRDNLSAMAALGIDTSRVNYFLPAYEWYNDSIVNWTSAYGLQLVNYTPGTLSHADYTGDKDKHFRDNETIYRSVLDREKKAGLNGYLLLMHIGAGPGRSEGFYKELPRLITELQHIGYQFKRLP